MGNIFRDTKPYTYAELCDMYKKFSMPHNQRPYAWKIAELSGLWEALIENESHYFLGTLVCLAPASENGWSLVVVDGQQRLTTLSLLLLAFRKVLFDMSENEKKSQDLQEMINSIESYIFLRDTRTHKLSPRLIPSKENLLSIYSQLTSSTPLTIETKTKDLDDNQLRYFANYKVAVALIKKEIKGMKMASIDELIQRIFDAQFIAIVIESEDQIYDLFEGLNSTGIGLSVADLLKNSVLKSTKTTGSRDAVESYWLQMESLFEKSKKIAWFPKFLRHYWIANNDYVSSSKLFDLIRRSKLKNKNSTDVVAFTKDLLTNAEIYMGLRLEDYESNLDLLRRDTKTTKLLATFRGFGMEQVFEVLLALYNKRKNDNTYKLSAFREDLERLLGFCLLAQYTNVNPSDYEKIFADICKITQTKTSTEYSKEVGGKFKALYKLVAQRDTFIESFSTGVQYGSDSRLIHFILTEIMRGYSKDDRGVITFDPEIEHILPKSPTKWGLSKESVADYVDLIGNLTILGEADNKDAGNELLKTKIEQIYQKSKFAFNHDIARYQEEFDKNPELAIGSRGRWIAGLVFDRFKIL